MRLNLMSRHDFMSTKSIRYFSSLSRGFDSHLDAHIFIEDVHLAVMPIGGCTEKCPEFLVQIEGEEKKKAKGSFASLARYSHGLDSEFICDIAEGIANQLSQAGRAVYEIVNDESNVHFIPFTTKRLVRFPGFYCQFIPIADYEECKKHFNFLKDESVWSISMPDQLGGENRYKKILKSLRAQPETAPDFWRQDLEKGKQSKYFDFSKYVLKSTIYKQRITKRWGWNERDGSLKNKTEYYSMYRYITFQWAKAVLREHIINELNELLITLSINASILVEGLLSPKEILIIRSQMEAGEISFSEAIDRTTF